MPAYAIALVDVKDQDKYQEYAKLAGPATARYGGRFVARGGIAAVLEGKAPYTRAVVVEFPDVETAKRFYASPEYAQARARRIGAADFNMMIVDGE